MRCFRMAGFWALLLGAAACSSQSDPVVLEVGDEVVRVAEFERLFWDAARRDTTLGPDAAGITKFAEMETESRLIQLLAVESQPQLEPGRQDRLLDFQQTSAVERLREIEYGDAFLLKESEIAAGYEKLGGIRHLRRALVASEREAEDIVRAVRDGALFDKMAATVSLDESSRAAGGDIGWLNYASLPDLDRGPVFDAPVGSVVSPIQAGRLWAIYQVVEEDTNTLRGTLAEETPRLRDLLVREKARLARNRYEADLLKKYEFRFHPAEVAWLTVYMHDKTAAVPRGLQVANAPGSEVKGGAIYSRGQVPWEGNPVAPADTARVVAETNHPGGRVTPTIVFEHLQSISTPAWPVFDKSQDVEDLVRSLILERVEFWEAGKRDYENSPEVQQAVQKREREIRRRQFNRNAIRTPLIPSEEEIRAEYEKRIEQYQIPERRSFLAVNVASSAAAERVVGFLEEGLLPDQMAFHFDESDGFQSTGKEGTPLMSRAEAGPLLSEAFFTTPEGNVSTPVAFGETFTVGKVLAVSPATVTPFADVKIKIQISMVDVLAEKKLSEVLTDARVRFPVTVYSDALAEVRGVDPRTLD